MRTISKVLGTCFILFPFCVLLSVTYAVVIFVMIVTVFLVLFFTDIIAAVYSSFKNPNGETYDSWSFINMAIAFTRRAGAFFRNILLVLANYWGVGSPTPLRRSFRIAILNFKQFGWAAIMCVVIFVFGFGIGCGYFFQYGNTFSFNTSSDSNKKSTPEPVLIEGKNYHKVDLNESTDVEPEPAKKKKQSKHKEK